MRVCAQLSMVESISQLIISSTHLLFAALLIPFVLSFAQSLILSFYLIHNSSFIFVIDVGDVFSLALPLSQYIHVGFEEKKTQNTSHPSIHPSIYREIHTSKLIYPTMNGQNQKKCQLRRLDYI